MLPVLKNCDHSGRERAFTRKYSEVDCDGDNDASKKDTLRHRTDLPSVILKGLNLQGLRLQRVRVRACQSKLHRDLYTLETPKQEMIKTTRCSVIDHIHKFLFAKAQSLSKEALPSAESLSSAWQQA